MSIKLKRAYEQADESDGERFLVDRLWPRGVSKGKAALTDWMKDVAPSDELRKWFGHDPEKWEEFRRRYEEELTGPAQQAELARLAEAARHGVVTLVFAARDRKHDNALVIRDVLERMQG